MHQLQTRLIAFSGQTYRGSLVLGVRGLQVMQQVDMLVIPQQVLRLHGIEARLFRLTEGTMRHLVTQILRLSILPVQ